MARRIVGLLGLVGLLATGACDEDEPETGATAGDAGDMNDADPGDITDDGSVSGDGGPVDDRTPFPTSFETPADIMQLRAALLERADDFTFDAPPETIDGDCTKTLSATGSGDADMLIEEVALAESYTVLCLSPGTYAMDKSVVVSSAANLTIKGLGATPADTILDFKDHTGDKGFDVTTPGFWIENLYVKNTTGNGVEVKASGAADNPTVFRKLKVDWDVAEDATLDCGDEDPRRDHGAYSVYPTKSTYVVVEFCEVEGASDAGLYIGQVEYGVVRHNKVAGNVAGLEVENSREVVVYDNEVTGNSGGILALQEPGLTRLKNEQVLIRDNNVYDNNGCNFAKPNTTVANIPAGTGLMSFAGQEIEFRNNTVTNNTTTGLLIVSNVLLDLLGGNEPDFDEAYDPYAHNIYVTGNTWTDNNTGVAMGDAGFVGLAAGGFKDVSWDGFRADSVTAAADAQICIFEDSATFLDITNDQCEMPADTNDFIACVTANASNDIEGIHDCTGGVTFEPFL